MGKYKYLLKNISILTIGNFSSKILVFLLVPIYTSILTTAEYGIYDLTASSVQLLMPVITANIIDAVMRFVMDKQRNQSNVATIGIRCILYSIIIAGIVLIICNYIELCGEVRHYELLVFCYYVFYVLNQYFIQLSKGLERIIDIAVAGIMGTVFMLAFNVLFLVIWHYGLEGFFLANILANAVPVAYFALRIKIWKYIKLKTIDGMLKKEMILYSVPLIAVSVGWWANSNLSRYLVAFICGISASGLLSVAYKIPSIINVIQGIFMQAWQISAIKEYEDDQPKKFYSTAFTYFNALMCFSCAGLILFSKPIAHILYAKDFFTAWEYVPFLLISSVINAAAGFIGSILAAQMKSTIMAKSAVYGFLINAVIGIALVWIIGVQGASISAMISSYVIYVVRKQAIGDLLDSPFYRRIMASWILLCIQAVVEIYTKLYVMQILLIVVQIVLYRQCIRNLFNQNSISLWSKSKKEQTK